jgi:hypothetical protein
MSLDFFPCQNPSKFSISFTTDAIQYNTIGCFVLAQKNQQKLSLVESHKKDFESTHMAHHHHPWGHSLMAKMETTSPPIFSKETSCGKYV